jgi:two-component system chemotaxis response regulator CheY
MKVLVTDDSRVMRQIVRRTLRQAGYTDLEVCEAENGRVALEVIASEEPDLVLCDWNMPEMSGIELLTSLRSRGRDVPFGFVTSEGSPQMRSRAENAGALFLIAKPFTPEAFRDALEPVLGSAP